MNTKIKNLIINVLNSIKTFAINAYKSVLNVLKIRKYQVSIGFCVVLSIIALFGILKVSALAITAYLIYEITSKNTAR